MERLVEMHIASFPLAFMTQLGRHFLATYYETVIGYPSGAVVVCESDCEPIGFAAAVARPDAFYQYMIHKWPKFLAATLTSAVTRPGSVVRAAHKGLRAQRTQVLRPEGVPDVALCELTSIAVAPSAQGKGVGRELVHWVERWSRSVGCNTLYLSTARDDNPHANSFYRGLSFSIQETRERDADRYMLYYSKQL